MPATARCHHLNYRLRAIGYVEDDSTKCKGSVTTSVREAWDIDTVKMWKISPRFSPSLEGEDKGKQDLEGGIYG